MKDFFQSQLEEIRENKARFGLIVVVFVVAVIIAVADSWDSGEEIKLEETAKTARENVPAKNISVIDAVPSEGKHLNEFDEVTVVVGANSNEVYVFDPFYNPAPPKEKTPLKKDEVPAKVEEKTLPQPAEKIVTVPPIEEKPKPPEEKFILHGVAIGEGKTALVEKIVEGKSETLFLKVGDTIGGKKILDMTSDFIELDDGERLEIKN